MTVLKPVLGKILDSVLSSVLGDSAVTKYFTPLDGSTQYYELFVANGTEVSITVYPTNGNTGLPPGAPTVTDNIWQTITFTLSSDSDHLGRNGANFFEGFVRDYDSGISFWPIGENFAETTSVIDTKGIQNGTAIAISESLLYMLESRFIWKALENYWTFGDISLDGTDAAFDVVAGSTGQGVTRGEAVLSLDWESSTLAGLCRFIIGTSTFNVGTGQAATPDNYIDSGGNERAYFQTRETGVTGGLANITLKSVLEVLDTRTEYTLVHLGDSITNYMLDQAIDTYQDIYENTYDKRVIAVNSGVGGNTIQQMSARLPALLSTYSGVSNVIFVIMAGTNQEVPEDLTAYSTVLTQMVTDIHAAGHDAAIVNKTASANDDQAGVEPDVNTLHNNVLCSSETPAWYSGGRPLIDAYTLTSGHHSPPTWFQDNVHPNELGRTNMRAYFAQKISTML